MKDKKICVTCGRSIEWRKKWQSCWNDIKFCSNRCRSNKLDKIDSDLELVILDLLKQRSKDSSICPSEAARAFFGENGWRNHMERTRQAARRLVHQGHLIILQKGQRVDPSKAKGPIRLKLLQDKLDSLNHK